MTDEINRTEPVPAWALTDLWSSIETAYLLCDLEPDPKATPEKLPPAVAAIYAHIKNACDLERLNFIDRTGKYPGYRLKPYEVIGWAKKHPLITVPERFAALAPDPLNREELESQVVALRARVEELERPAPPSPDEELEPSERITLLKFAALVAGKFDFDETAKTNYCTSVIRNLSKDYNAPLSEKTINKWLRMARTKYPYRKTRK